MKDNDWLQLSAYLDEELSAQDMAQIRKRLANEPELARALKRLQGADSAVSDAVHSIDEQPMSQNLAGIVESLYGAEHVVSATDTPASDTDKNSKAYRTFWPMAFAACFAFVVVLVFNHKESPVEGMLTSSAQPNVRLVEFLSTKVAGESQSIHDVTVSLNMSFIRQDQSLCRQFQIHDEHEVTTGVACYEDQQWKTMALSSSSRQGNKDMFQPAGAESHLIGQYVEQHIEGVALSAEEEREQLKRMRSF